jgi:hypothetical protein
VLNRALKADHRMLKLMQQHTPRLLSLRSTLGLLFSASLVGVAAAQSASSAAIPPDATYACPMEAHPDEADPAHQGPYFANRPGKCPWCGMTLKPIEQLPWAMARKAAAGAEVAYTCPKHPHVFSKTGGKCPRCNADLQPFRVNYTCPDPAHADIIQTHPGRCPRDGRKLVPFRGIWLSPEMAAANAPPRPEVAAAAAYRCPLHPLVHSDKPGPCTICGSPLKPAAEIVDSVSPPPASQPPAESADTVQPSVPADAKYVCPMEECQEFSAEPGKCPKCGMRLKPSADVPWARAAQERQRERGGNENAKVATAAYLCPMHPDQARAAGPGACPICGMQLIPASALNRPTTAPAAIAAQMNYLMEHYLALQQRFAADRLNEVPLHALGLASAADEISRRAGEPEADLPREFKDAIQALRTAAVKIRGKDLAEDRVAFADVSSAMRTLLHHVRPDRQHYPKIYIFHCPTSKADWLQNEPEPKNPYYGFQMLTSGELQGEE